MQKGFTAVTMSDLCDASGLSRGGLYRHFSSTKDVFVALRTSDKDNWEDESVIFLFAQSCYMCGGEQMDKNSLLFTDKEFAELYQRNKDMVYRMCYLYLKNTADAEDATQSIFLKVINMNKAFNEREHEKAWFITTTKNYCKDILKSWWNNRRVDLDVLLEVAHWDDTETGEVFAKIFSLPEKYKTVMYLFYAEDYSIKEIAAILNREETTVQTQLSRGRERLKIDLGGKYNG